MRFKVLSMIAVVSLVAACSTTPTETGSTTGTGGASAPMTTTTPTAPSGAVVSGPAAGTQEDLVVNVGDRVHFGFDKYNLTSEARYVLQKQAAWLKANPSVRVTIEGHTDERGTREYNLALGERRANAVRDYLVAQGISPDRMDVVSYGKERPVALGSNEQAWAQNRRAVTVVK